MARRRMIDPLKDYSSSKWKHLREEVFKRDNGQCISCKKQLVLHSGKYRRCSFKANIHHKIPRSKGGGDEPGNLITLCFKCHYKYNRGGENAKT